jgi:GNAT superfamily N-acetyltransferase
MVADVLTLERAGLKAWPGLETEWDGSWVRRAARGYTKRANSMQSLDPADDADPERRLRAGAHWLGQRGLPAVYRATPLTGPATLAALQALGWREIDRSDHLAMPLNIAPGEPTGASDLAPLDAAFVMAQACLNGYGKSQTDGLTALLGALHVPARGFLIADEDGSPLASCLMAIADGIVVTGNVVTRSDRRGQGLGTRIMLAGLGWAASAGAHTAALNVMTDNPAAQALYRRLGYHRQYGYSYFVES